MMMTTGAVSEASTRMEGGRICGTGLAPLRRIVVGTGLRLLGQVMVTVKGLLGVESPRDGLDTTGRRGEVVQTRSVVLLLQG